MAIGTTGMITNFSQQAADQQRFLADSLRAKCPQTVATMGVLQERPAPEAPAGYSPGPMGTNNYDQGMLSDMLQAQQSQRVTQLMLRACSAEAGEGAFPNGFFGR